MIKSIITTIISMLYESKWLILSIVGLFILAINRENFIVDTYAYVFLLNIPIFIIPLLVLRRIDALRYYLHVAGITFFIVWIAFYSINFAISKDAKALKTHRIKSTHYIPKGRAGISTSRGIRYVYNGHTLMTSPTEESERLYEIYGDSVTNHIHVRLSLKKALPQVYYIDSTFIDYDE